jgi:hypothetical protein
MKNKEDLNSIQIGKEEVLLADNMIVYVEKLEESTKIAEI